MTDNISIFVDSGLKILGLKNVMVLDWDLTTNKTEKEHPDYKQKATITTREDVIKIVRENMKYIPADLKNFGLRLYYTPNGVRGIYISRPLYSRSTLCDVFMRIFKCDPAYRYLSILNECWHLRVSPKERENDYVACYWRTIGNNQKIHPEIIPMIKIHDELCRTNRKCALPEIFKPTSVLEAAIRSIEEEPWEAETNKGILHDLVEDLEEWLFCK